MTGVEGFEPPTWDALANDLRPPTHDADEYEPGAKRGWQHEAASRVERQFRGRLMERMAEHEQALLRLGWPSPRVHQVSRLALTHTCSGWSCCAVFASLSLSPYVSVVVAVSSILLAFVELRA